MCCCFREIGPAIARFAPEMLQRSGQPGIRPYHVARACTLAPDSVNDFALPKQLAAVELQQNNWAFWSLTEQAALAYRAGRYDEAAVLCEKSLKADPRLGRAVLNWLWLALVENRRGKLAAAQAWLKKSTDWLKQFPNIPIEPDEIRGLHLHNWLEAKILHREAEAALALTTRLTAMIRGEEKPADDADRLVIIKAAYDFKKFAFATKLWEEALSSDPKFGDDPRMQHRYNAARAAALAAAGQGKDEPALDGAAKAKLRGQALDWLKAELITWSKLAESSEDQPFLAQSLSHWQKDSDLAGIRDATALAKLPAEEQKAFTQFWVDVSKMETLVLLKSALPPLLKFAALQAWYGQDKELAATCDRALKFAMSTKDPTTAERTAKICCLRQADAKTHEAALVLARRAVELGKNHDYLVYFQMCLGMAEYRCGHYVEANAALSTASRLTAGTERNIVDVTSSFYRAMSLFRQGNESEARKLAIKSVAKMRPIPADEKNPLANANADDLIVWMAYKEAKALIRFDKPVPVPERELLPPPREIK